MPITRNARDMVGWILGGCTAGTTQKLFGSTGAVVFIGNSTAAHSATSTFLTAPLAIATDGPIASTMNYAAACFCSSSTYFNINYRFTFSTCAASGTWGEWGIFNATSSGTDGVLLNRYPDNLGIKSTAASWQLDVTIGITT